MITGTYIFTVTATDIINEAMLNIGAIGEAEIPTAQEFNDCLRKLNLLVKSWMAKQDFAPGLKMWSRARGDLFLGFTQYQYQLGPTGDNWAGFTTGNPPNLTYNSTTLASNAGQGATNISVNTPTVMNQNDYIGILIGTDLFWTTVSSYSNGLVGLNAPLTGNANANAQVFNYTTKQQRPLQIETCILRDTFANDTPMNKMTLEDYELLPTKTSNTFQSDPTAIYYESQIGTSTATSNGQLYIDVGGAQDVTKLLHIVYLNPISDITNPVDNPAYPQQWYRPLCWGLSREICGMFDASWTDEMKENLSEALAFAQQQDAEVTSFYFQRDSGSPYEP